MTTERLARIDSLLDPGSLMTTERRAMQPDLGWDPAETVGRKKIGRASCRERV